jgi:hypothetical protein
MADIALQIGSVAEKAVTEGAKGPAGQGESSFSKLLSERLENTGEMGQAVLKAFGLAPKQEIQAISAEGLEIQPAQITVKDEMRTHGKALSLLTDVNRQALQMDSFIELASSGRHFTPAELLALQAGVHQIALNVDLTGKILEQLNGGVQRLLQTNFGA